MKIQRHLILGHGQTHEIFMDHVMLRFAGHTIFWNDLQGWALTVTNGLENWENGACKWPKWRAIKRLKKVGTTNHIEEAQSLIDSLLDRNSSINIYVDLQIDRKKALLLPLDKSAIENRRFIDQLLNVQINKFMGLGDRSVYSLKTVRKRTDNLCQNAP